jgi:hypothetical protein
MLDNGWVEIKTDFINPSFLTHLHYINTLKEISNNITLQRTNRCTSTSTEPQELAKKLKLIKLTKGSMESEMKMIKADPEYAILCISWVSVKSYYLIFNLLIVLEFLWCSDCNVFRTITHEELRKRFKDKLSSKELKFNVDLLNQVYKSSDILGWKFPAGTNLRATDTERYKQLVKKLYEYAKEDFKRNKKIKQLRGGLKDEFNNKTRFTISDFFYYYRIKANYRDLEFLDENLDTSKFVEFYESYYLLTMNFYKALIDLINSLSNIRLGKSLI